MFQMNLTAIKAMETLDKLYLGLGLLTSLASLLACVTLMFAMSCIPAIRNRARNIVLCIVISNAGASIGTVMAVAVKIGYRGVSWESHPVCEAAATFAVMFRISGYLWTVALALHLCFEAWQKDSSLALPMTCPAHSICWGFPCKYEHFFLLLFYHSVPLRIRYSC
jgi:hypothetical protein